MVDCNDPQGFGAIGYSIKLRDIFAGMAMQAFISRSDNCLSLSERLGIAKESYEVANMLLAAREKQTQEKE